MTPFADDMSARGFFHVITRSGKDKTDEKTGSADKL